MSKKIFLIGFGTILFLGLLLRLIPLIDNNFYFTMDQANEAVQAREIWHRHQFILIGQETSIPGFYNGPLWHWFISIGYFIFAGHPFGPLFFLILTKLTLTAILMWQFSRRLSFISSLIIGGSLQFFWPFFDTSRYAFSPFPLVTAAALTVLLLTNSLEGKGKQFILAAAGVGLSWHTELASFPPLFILFLLVGMWSLVSKRLSVKTLGWGFFLLFTFFIPHLISETTSGFPQVLAIINHLDSSRSVFSQTRFSEMTQFFLNLIGQSISPQIPTFGLLIFFLIIMLFLKIKLKKTNIFITRFVSLTFLLTIISWLWFSFSSGWSHWHTVYISPLLFIAILLLIFSLPAKISRVILLVILVSNFFFFYDRYKEIMRLSQDASLLTNELKAIDWVYQNASEKGFYVYTYLPSVYDWPYQYLFWWHGLNKYKYLPCEYSTYPDVPDFFVPGLKYYQTPKRECQNMRFLIIEPDKNIALLSKWLEGVSKDTKLVAEKMVGTIKIEKRILVQEKQEAE